MKPIELVKLIKQENPELLAELPDKKAASLIRAFFYQLGMQINAMEEGILKVPGFGNFRIILVEKEKDGQKITTKRIVFRPIKAKENDDKNISE